MAAIVCASQSARPVDLWRTLTGSPQAHRPNNSNSRAEQNEKCVTHVAGQNCHPCSRLLRASPAACRIRAKGVSGMARISVAMMTHNETAEFRWLMEALAPALDVIDEI